MASQHYETIRVEQQGLPTRFRPRSAKGPVAFLAAVVFAAAPAAGDEITVNGTRLEGQVASLASDHLVFDTVYGEGSIQIRYVDIESISAGGRFHVFHDEDGESVGRLLSLEGGFLEIGEDPARATTVEAAKISSGLSEKRYEESPADRFRAQWRHWSFKFDLGADTERSTTDTVNVATGVRLERRKGPTRLRFDASYELETERKDGQSSKRSTNDLYGVLRGDYDLRDRWFVFGSTDAEHDGIDEVSFRNVSLAGLGYRLIRNEKGHLSLDAGPGHVYERFFGGDDNSFVTAAFGAESEFDLGWGQWSASIQYTPAVDDWTNDYLLRAETALEMPLVDFVFFRIVLSDEYDSTPSDEAEPNTFAALLGLSFGF